MQASSKKDFFVSYNERDRKWAEWIAWQLEKAGYTVLIQAWDFRPGHNFALKMQQASAEAERIIAVLSHNYLQACYTQPEWAAGFVQDPTGEKGSLLPVRIAECKLEGLWAGLVYIDLVGLEEEVARQALLDGLNRERVKPSVSPQFPGNVFAAEHAVTGIPRFPGILSPIWNVPYLRNPNFAGREDLLQQLHEVLFGGKQTVLIQAIHGLGGVGKSQLAIEYVYRHLSEYDLIWWVHAEKLSILDDYVALATNLKLPEVAQREPGLICDALRRWLESHGRWLLIFDNAQSPDDLVPLLPKNPAGHVLITSRNSDWGNMAHPLWVQVFPRAESLAYLSRVTDQYDEQIADQLAEELGDLPLALAQAAAYIRQSGRTLDSYLQLFRRRRKELLARGGASPDYSASVATTWEMALTEVKRKCPAAAALLNLIAFLAPDNIPCEVIRARPEFLPEPLSKAAADDLLWDEAISVLRRFSLVEVYNDMLSVHRLVQAVTRDRLTQTRREKCAVVALQIVSASFPFDSDDVRTWPVCERLLAHGLSAASHIEDLGVKAGVGHILNQIGLYLTKRADSGNAKKCLEWALASNVEYYGYEHVGTASVLLNLGLVSKDMGQIQEAEQYARQALGIDEAISEAGDSRVARDLAILGDILRAAGDQQGALGCFERALQISQAADDTSKSAIARDLHNMGSILIDFGRLEEARDFLTQAIEMDERCYGSDHPEIAFDLNSLGDVLVRLGSLEEARKCHEQAISISQQAYGFNHPDVARGFIGLGSVELTTGDTKAALACFEKALDILVQIYGPGHIQLGLVLDNIGSVFENMGDLDKALVYHQSALDVSLAAYGISHPHVAVRASFIGKMLVKLGRLSDGVKYFQLALRASEGVYGPTDFSVVGILAHLAELLSQMHDLRSARSHLERAIHITEQAQGDNSPVLAALLNNLGRILHYMGQLDSSRICHERAIQIAELTISDNHPDFAVMLSSLGMVLRELGKLDEARYSHERAIRVATECYGIDHTTTATCINNLGRVLQDMGQFQKAKGCYKKALRILRRHLPPDHAQISRTEENLAAVTK